MKFKYYFRKSSFKKDIDSANILLEQIEIHKPQNFLEVGVFQGVTSKNVCEKLYEINKENFLFHGIDVFENTDSNFDSREKTTKHNRLSNPLKFYLKIDLIPFEINDSFGFLKYRFRIPFPIILIMNCIFCDCFCFFICNLSYNFTRRAQN